MTELHDPVDAAPEEGVVGGPWLDDEDSRAASSALLFGIGLLMAGNGLQGSLLGIRAEAAA